MSKKRLILESMLRKFEHIDKIVSRHGGVSNALDDEPKIKDFFGIYRESAGAN